ncbi:Zn(II)2Cys6 transcription factor [Aspergillus heteromorphus CBS 117.55]|uniref:Zn(II)2Cys6 transcription factor n=1 Tax=Aspergillus heteromorphus CBS 117.55 TaxID=1448321 RepID=A0A317X1B4_9EURO|nr:Zn(II)2Cys6 transcription factor [Aspergillus heteromorphus CBS 117.55]PWY90738.1 Zn(II)2Cys6 transcription factor [Aspergillus heteromorphus CBS 117.55]
MRSRTGCLTCRTRKLKCDEQKPECSQCRKGGRECRPSEGIVFRHQQNASMNKDLEGASTGRGSLKGFYSYKNTFDKDSVWLDIPKHVIFVDNSDPYAEDLEAALGESEAAILAANSQTRAWSAHRTLSADGETHGLEALSTVAAHDRLSYPSVSIDHPSISPTDNSAPFSNVPPPLSSGSSPTQIRGTIAPLVSPPLSITSTNNHNNNINFLLNPSQSRSPPVDPHIQHAPQRRSSSLTSRTAAPRTTSSDAKPDVSPETDREVAYLLRHFSEVPGLWMDLFDLGTYFASYVPVRALRNPLLKYAACAYAAKQLGRVRGGKVSTGGVYTRQDANNVDWSWRGAKYYEKAIQLLMKELQPDKGPPPLSTPEAFGQWQAAELCEDNENPRKRRRRYSDSRFSKGLHSDEILAATAILSVYEFLDATGPAWNRHLSGVKSLLDVAEVGMMPVEQRPSPGGTSLQQPKLSGLSKARRATFWNFARQDYLAAFINESQTRLNTDDLVLWTEAGLHIDNMGFPSSTGTAGYLDSEEAPKEDLISNALVWILSKIVNFISAGDNIQLGHPGSMDASTLGLSQQVLLERWYRLEAELDVWHNGLPMTFQPCARVELCKLPHNKDSKTFDAGTLSEIWFSLPMCSSAMQHYHMARILLLINKPHESTSRRSTITDRLNSYRSIESDIRSHSREIVGIALACPNGSVRINSLQPLFVSGQCLNEPGERRTVLQLLRGIEADLGWATEYRVNQLLREWGWNENPVEMGVS